MNVTKFFINFGFFLTICGVVLSVVSDTYFGSYGKHPITEAEKICSLVISSISIIGCATTLCFGFISLREKAVSK